MNKYLLFVDVETSGIPESMKAPVSATDQWPYILQVAWQVYDYKGKLIKTEDHYLYDERIQIDKSSEKVHGLNKDTLLAVGELRKDVMRKIGADLRHYKPVIVGHFVEFDSKMLQVAMHRSGLKNIITKYPQYCTMLASSEYKLLPNQGYPKLDELYTVLFKKRPANIHHARADVSATAACFFEMVRRGNIDLNHLDMPATRRSKIAEAAKPGCGLPVLLFIILFVWSLL